MFPVSSNNLVPGNPAVNSIPVQIYGPRHSSPDPHHAFNSPRPPNVGPILSSQLTIPSAPMGPNMRLFTPPTSSIPWGSGAFQGFSRPPIPAPMVSQPGTFPENPKNPPIQQTTGSTLIPLGSGTNVLQNAGSRSLGHENTAEIGKDKKNGTHKRKPSRWDRNEGNKFPNQAYSGDKKGIQDLKHKSKDGVVLKEDYEENYYDNRTNGSSGHHDERPLTEERDKPDVRRDPETRRGQRSSSRSDGYQSRHNINSDGGNHYSDSRDSSDRLGYRDDQRDSRYEVQGSSERGRSLEYDSAGSRERGRLYKHRDKKSYNKGRADYVRDGSVYSRHGSEERTDLVRGHSHHRKVSRDQRQSNERDDCLRGAVLREDRVGGTILREDRIERGNRPVLREDRIERSDANRAVLREDKFDGREGNRAVLREDRFDRVDRNRLLLREDRIERSRPTLRDDRFDVREGNRPVLREDRFDVREGNRPVLRDDRFDVREGNRPVLREDRIDRREGNRPVLREDRFEVRDGHRTVLREDRFEVRDGHRPVLREDRFEVRDGHRPVLREDRIDSRVRNRPVLREDRIDIKDGNTPVLRDDRNDTRDGKRPFLREDGIDSWDRNRPVLREDRIDTKDRNRPVLREDRIDSRDRNRPVLREDRIETRDGNRPVLRDDRFDVSEGNRPVLREDRLDKMREKVLREDSVSESRGKGAVFREDRVRGAVLRDDRIDAVRDMEPVLREDRSGCAIPREDRNRERTIYREDCVRETVFKEDTRRGALLLEDRESETALEEYKCCRIEGRHSDMGERRNVLTEERDSTNVRIGTDNVTRGPIFTEDGAGDSNAWGALLREDRLSGEVLRENQMKKLNGRDVVLRDNKVKKDVAYEALQDQNREERTVLRQDPEREAILREDESHERRRSDTVDMNNRENTMLTEDMDGSNGAMFKGVDVIPKGIDMTGDNSNLIKGKMKGLEGSLGGQRRFMAKLHNRKPQVHPMNRQKVTRGNRAQMDTLNDQHKGQRDRGNFGSDRGQRGHNQQVSGFDHQSRGNSQDRRERSSSLPRPFSRSGVNKRSRPDSETDESRSTQQPRFKRQRLEDMVEDSQTQCVRSGTPVLLNDESEIMDEDELPAWVRCSAADLYFRKDRKTGNLESTKRMQELEKKFDQTLVQRASQVKANQVPYEKPVWKPKLSFKHKCKGHPAHNHKGGKCKKEGTPTSSSSSSSSDTDESDSDEEEEEWWKEAVRHKEGNPYRMHKDLWYNEHGELNYGPLCRCSVKCRKFGIRHDIYPGEKPLPKCSGTSNNLDKLFHYKITISPVTNFLTKHPTIINFDGHEYMFEGFSIFSHKPIPKLPPCQVIRFNIVYTIHIIEEQPPENFSVESLDLFADFLFTELLELVDIDWKGPGGEEHCRRFHMMPRFARPFPENGKEVLSMNDVFLYLIKSSKPIIDNTELATLVQLDHDRWQHFVDGFRHMVVTKPGMRPSSIRIDQLDKQNCTTDDKLTYPLIIHHGNRPTQLSYAGDNNYRKKWKEYLKFKHLLWSRTKVTPKDKDKLEELEAELHKIRSKFTMKKEVSIEISSEGFLLTGIRSDICQHAMMLPVLFNHVRFHECINEFEARIGYTFKDKSLIQLALTHASYKVNYGTNPDHGRNSMYNCGSRHLELGDIKIHHQHTRKRGLNILLRIMSKMAKKQEERSEIPHNERLEFLGDAVVEFITSIHLFYMFPQADEGELTMYRGALVRNAHFSILAEKLGLHEYLLYAHGSDLCHEGDLKHAMANCFEALLGALYLDGGIEVSDRVFTEVLFDEADLLDIWRNLPKHQLQSEEPNGDRHWIENSPALKKLVKFENDIGYEFYNIRLLAKAFTQRSVGYNRLTHGHNQRLEFLGDTVMQLISSDYLFRHFPDHHEGHLTLLRSSLVNNKTQSSVADDIGMTNFVLKSRNDDLSQMKQKEKADLLEALLGAMYVDGGIEPCTTLCNVCFFPKLEMFILNQDWNDPKSQLQQSCLTLRDTSDEYPDIPVYKVLNASGPTNTRLFKVAVYFRGKRLAMGEGRSIQQGEMNAAERALKTNKAMFNVKLRARMGIK